MGLRLGLRLGLGLGVVHGRAAVERQQRAQLEDTLLHAWLE